MNAEKHHEQTTGGCCGGRQAAASPTLAELERQLHALWARIQEERVRQGRETEPAKKKSCCCG